MAYERFRPGEPTPPGYNPGDIKPNPYGGYKSDRQYYTETVYNEYIEYEKNKQRSLARELKNLMRRNDAVQKEWEQFLKEFGRSPKYKNLLGRYRRWQDMVQPIYLSMVIWGKPSNSAARRAAKLCWQYTDVTCMMRHEYNRLRKLQRVLKKSGGGEEEREYNRRLLRKISKWLRKISPLLRLKV